MTDTLRAECEAFLNTIESDSGIAMSFTPTEWDEAVRLLLAFARAQQAKGLLEAAELCRTKTLRYDTDWWHGVTKQEVSRIVALDLGDLLQAQATVREHEHE